MKNRPTAADVRDQFTYDPETGEFLRKNLRARNMRPETGSVSKGGYLIVGINGGHEMIHRLIWLWVHGDWPPKQIEHVNSDKSDNRIANLRLRNPAPQQELTVEYAKGLIKYVAETGKFYWRNTTRGTKENDEAGHVRANGYRVIMISGISCYAHRLVWFFERNEWPKNWIDHKNGDRDDNKIENLRDVTPSQNSHNTNKLGPKNTTGFRGVSKYLDKYVAQMMINGVSEAIGMFDAPELAAAAYKARYIEVFGCEPSNENLKVYYRKSRAKKS